MLKTAEFFILLYIFLPKPVWEKLSESEGGVFVLAFCEIDLEIGGAELRHYLSADAARREEIVGRVVCSACYGDSGEILFALAYRLENGDALGADGGGVGGVFYVTACIDLSRACKECRADLDI